MDSGRVLRLERAEGAFDSTEAEGIIAGIGDEPASVLQSSLECKEKLEAEKGSFYSNTNG